MSLAARIGLWTFCVEVAVLLAFGLIARHLAHSELTGAFDEALRANAHSLESLVEVDERGVFEVEFAGEVMERFSRVKSADVFAIFDSSGHLLAKAPALKQIPGELEAVEENVRDLEIQGAPYRCAFLRATARQEADEAAGANARILVFFARPRASLDASLRRVTLALAILLGIGVAGAALLAALAARLGLRPLRDFAGEMDRVHSERLESSVDASRLPLELRRPAEAFERLLARLAQAFERERRFSAGAAHELRTPVASLKAAIQAARRTPREPENDAALLASLECETERLEALCEQLLLCAGEETDSGGETISLRQLAEELEETVRRMRPLAEAAGARVEWIPPAAQTGDPLLRGSRFAVQRIAGNLLANAIQHGGPGVHVRISLEAAGQGARATFEDDGAGIAEEFRARLFERFFRADPSRSRAQGGTGLGLAISRELARAWGGELLYAKPAQRGACFQWTLAAAPEGASGAIHESSPHGK